MSTWKIDPTHSTLEFAAKHMMITTVKGSFSDVQGTITLDPAAPTAEVAIPVASITTRVADRDAHLKSPDFFDAETHPEITFRSTGIEGAFAQPGDAFTLLGELTIRGTTKPVAIKATFEGQGKDPWGGTRASFLGSTTIDRRDFGLTWNAALETGGVLVSNDIKITLDVQAVAA